MAPPAKSDDLDDLVGQVVEEYFQRVEQGQRPQLDEFAERYPEISGLLKKVIPALQAAEQTSDNSANADPAREYHKQLGDFRILRQIGRGGMGIVYEAEQISMTRRVALKVLPLAGLVDELKIHRFQNEVRAVAALNHPNIVPVYMVGQERGVHYYAMQLIHGRSLSDVILSLQRVRDEGEPLDGESISQITNIGQAGDAVDPGLVDAGECTQHDVDGNIPPAVCETVAEEDGSTIPHSSRREYLRSVAALGIQAASALQHAHEQGVVHRDIKPANLLLDSSATLFVTDFGLARMESDVGVTMTGDLIGTLRYMAPEQALAKRVVVDHRADIYSLGVTLYELVTLQPAYRADDQQQLLKQLAFEEPTPLRRLDREIPSELATIIHKAMSKDMDQRYTSAQELSDDLRSHLENRPIKAKPPTTTEIIGKWARRNPAWTWAAIVTLSLVTLTLASSTVFVSKQRDLAQNKASQLARRNYLLHLANADKALLGIKTNYSRARVELDACPPEHRGWEWRFLDGRIRATIPQSFPGAEQPIFSRDGKRLIAIGALGTPAQRMAHIWELPSGKLVKALKHESRLRRIVLSPDESRIAAGDDNGSLFVWNIETGEKVWSVKKHNAGIRSFSPDGNRIATGGSDQTVTVLDAMTGQVQFTVPVGGEVSRVRFSPEGHWMAVGLNESEKQPMLIDVATGEIAATFPGTGHMIPTFDAKGQRIATSNMDGSITLWGWDGEQLSPYRSWKGSNRYVWSLEFTADGDQLVSGDREDGVRVWDVATGQRIAALDFTYSVGGLATAPQDALIAFFNVLGGIRLWRYGEHQESITVTPVEGATVARFSPNGQRIAASSAPSFVKWAASELTIHHGQTSVLDAVSGTNVLDLGGELHSASWISDGRYLVAAADAQREIRVFSTSTGTITRAFTVDAAVAFARVAPSGRRLVTVFRDGTIGAWDFQTGEKMEEFAGGAEDRGDLIGVGISTDNARVAVAFYGAFAVEVWDVRTQSLTRSLAVPGVYVKTVAFSNHGNSIYVGGINGRMIRIDIESGKQDERFTGHEGWVSAIALSPDEDQIVSGDYLGRVIVWDDVSALPLVTLIDAGQPVISLDWSSDGQRIVAGKGDGTVQIWALPRTQ